MSEQNIDNIDDDNDTEISSSKLGTLDYWEKSYEKEIENFEEFGDQGEIWFGIQSVKRVLNWIMAKSFDKSTTSFLDIGCGNGFTCCRLAAEGFKQINGIDYSEKAIELSRSIAKKKNLEISFQVIDVLDKNQYDKISNVNVGIDKGTYDAIALCPDDPKTKRQLYKQFLVDILNQTNAIFIITSCNWTHDELVNFFTKDKEFEFVEEIKPVEQPKFLFGGKSGNTTTTIVFKRL